MTNAMETTTTMPKMTTRPRQQPNRIYLCVCVCVCDYGIKLIGHTTQIIVVQFSVVDSVYVVVGSVCAVL